jgi:hypothetical protein
VDDVGKQATGTRTALIARKSFCVSDERSFPLGFTRPTDQIFLFSSDLQPSFSSAESSGNTYAFLFREKPSHVSQCLSLLLLREESSAARSEPIVYSSRHVQVIWRRGAGARGVVFWPECYVMNML